MSDTIAVVKAIGQIMSEKGWTNNGARGAIKKDVNAKTIAKWGSPEFHRDFEEAVEILSARNASSELARRSSP